MWVRDSCPERHHDAAVATAWSHRMSAHEKGGALKSHKNLQHVPTNPNAISQDRIHRTFTLWFIRMRLLKEYHPSKGMIIHRSEQLLQCQSAKCRWGSQQVSRQRLLRSRAWSSKRSIMSPPNAWREPTDFAETWSKLCHPETKNSTTDVRDGSWLVAWRQTWIQNLRIVSDKLFVSASLNVERKISSCLPGKAVTLTTNGLSTMRKWKPYYCSILPWIGFTNHLDQRCSSDPDMAVLAGGQVIDWRACIADPTCTRMMKGLLDADNVSVISVQERTTLDI